MSRPTLAHALACAYGLAEPDDFNDLVGIVNLLQDHPEALTNGEACRGLERLRREAYGPDEE